MIELENDNLAEFLSDNPKTIVQYGAKWCGNCRMIKPQIKNLSGKTEGISFVYVDAEKLPESRKLASVTNLPTFAAFVNGELVKQNQGNKIELVQELIDEVTNH